MVNTSIRIKKLVKTWGAFKMRIRFRSGIPPLFYLTPSAIYTVHQGVVKTLGVLKIVEKVAVASKRSRRIRFLRDRSSLAMDR